MTTKGAFLILLNFTRFMIQQSHLYIGHAYEAAGGGGLEKKGVFKNSSSESCQVKFSVRSMKNTYEEIQF